MEVFRTRRERAAQDIQQTPGLDITYKVGGRVAKRRNDRNDEGRNTKHARVGDFAYAGDTAIVGVAAEVKQAEPIFTQTVAAFAGKVHENKTESLRVCQTARPSYDVPEAGEQPVVKHVGTMLAERAGHAAETDRAARHGVQRVEQVAPAWSKGRQVHARQKDLKLSVRIRVLKAVVKGVMFTFVRTRSWQTCQVNRLQSIINLAVRRAFNVRTSALRRCGLSNAILCRMVQWEPFLISARRASLLWLGHVARMDISAP